MKMKSCLFALIVVLTVSGIAHSFVIGGSNFRGFGEYEDHTCIKPSKPITSPLLDNEFFLNQYRFEMETYRDCIQRYVENGKNDIERIKEKIKDAVDQYNSR